ncbi:MAG: hypothetical protein AABY00_02270 [Nanoarchaeota archaeon]
MNDINIQSKIRSLCKKISLKYEKKLYTNYVCDRKAIIIDNYLSGCPDQLYSKHKNNTSENKERHLQKFILSKEFKEEMKKPRGAKTNGKDSIWKMNILRKSKIDEKMLKKMKIFYKKVKKLDNGFGVSIVDHKTFKEKEVILHEYIHILLDSNKIRPASWKWNEGLTTYLTSYILNREKIHKNKPKKEKFKSAFMYAYYAYAHKWYNLLHKENQPEKKLNIIKIKSLK